MNLEMIPIQRTGGIRTVNARELHALLGVGKGFSTWIKNRISQYGFEEGRDFTVTEILSRKISGNSKARPQKMKEYHITLNMAKELSIMERTPSAKLVRRLSRHYCI